MSRLTDHQAYALADQIYGHLGYRPARKMGKTAFGHRVASLVDMLAGTPAEQKSGGQPSEESGGLESAEPDRPKT